MYTILIEVYLSCYLSRFTRLETVTTQTSNPTDQFIINYIATFIYRH